MFGEKIKENGTDESDSRIYADYINVRQNILIVYYNLIEAYSYYRQHERQGQDFQKGKIRWYSLLEQLYLCMMTWINKGEYKIKYKETIDFMNEYIEGKELTDEKALKCQVGLMEFTYDIGITRIEMETQDWETSFDRSF